jgi:hypothetical protein
MMKEYKITHSVLLLLVIACSLAARCSGFLPKHAQQQRLSIFYERARLAMPGSSYHSTTRIQAEQQEQGNDILVENIVGKNSKDEFEPTTDSKQEEESSRYPINLPSPILLASSMILAIASTGKYVFFLSDFGDILR